MTSPVNDGATVSVALLQLVEEQRDEALRVLRELDLYLDFSTPMGKCPEVLEVEDPSGINGAFESARALLSRYPEKP